MVKKKQNPDLEVTLLHSIGRTICGRRKLLKLSAEAIAKSAGISRVTLHRIEKGDSGVSFGSYIGVIRVLGLNLELSAPEDDLKNEMPPIPDDIPQIPIHDYPQLKSLGWQLDDDSLITPLEAKNLYERGEKYLNFSELTHAEKDLIEILKPAFKSRPH